MREDEESRTPLTPEAIIDILRTLREQIGEVVPLTFAERRELRHRVLRTEPILHAGVNVIGAADAISRAIGVTVEEVRAMLEESVRWTAVETELQALLNGVSGANLVRRDRVARMARQAAIIAAQLARDPARAELVPYAEEIAHLKRVNRRKKGAGEEGAGTP